ncbi:glycosyltransferase family 4 protein [Leptolyngbya sp. FACHB-711]|uniref:glycosyltransferase family 4 protein n=1 Tax=Leptolyngbya sp. FACHB-711 TaxID=2692813 RepID=UPI0016897B19|nr:glycosyltransferase family 4 protein [Leptolyngbya sp. FACHB-711]MBD2028208.1 glycosyltransferase family 4 protein [Leptolyngbya sp. FACHB-711]
MDRLKVTFYSILPSPYQRDLFYELSCRPEVDLKVLYLESSYPDNPWSEKPLQLYEKTLLGGCLTWGASRFHYNWHLPQLKNTDVIVFNGYQNLAAQQILHTQSKQLPCIFWGERMVANSMGVKGQVQRLLAAGLGQCRAIVAIGSRAQQDYQQRFPKLPIFNIPYYCNLSDFKTTIQRPRHPITILFCGQMIERKGVDLLLQAFDRLIQTGAKARLLLVGREAELPTMMQSISADAKQSINYAGFHDPEYLPQFFEQADIFVLPSRYDGWGVVVNQALGAGLPIICSDAVGAAPDLVEPGVNGAIVPAGDAKALYSALMHYISNPETIAAASQASITKGVAWTPQVGAERWVEVFQKFSDLAAGNRRKG